VAVIARAAISDSTRRRTRLSRPRAVESLLVHCPPASLLTTSSGLSGTSFVVTTPRNSPTADAIRPYVQLGSVSHLESMSWARISLAMPARGAVSGDLVQQRLRILRVDGSAPHSLRPLLFLM